MYGSQIHFNHMIFLKNSHIYTKLYMLYIVSLMKLKILSFFIIFILICVTKPAPSSFSML